MSSPARNVMPELCNRQNPLHYGTALNLLMIAGIDLNQVNLLPVGTHENYKGEVLEQDPAAGTALKSNTQITLRVGCHAAVDNLPYQFFYGLTARRETGAVWEEHARHTTAMLDSPEIRYSALALKQILKYNFAVPDQNHVGHYLDLFQFSQKDISDYQEQLRWAMLLPGYHDWAGNPDQVAAILEKMFGYRFRIVESIESEYEIPEEIRYRLGAKTGRIGRETILGRTFIEFDSAYQVIVCGISRDEVTRFLPGGDKRKRVEEVLKICMPSNLTYKITFETDVGSLKLGEKSRLGYSTRI